MPMCRLASGATDSGTGDSHGDSPALHALRVASVVAAASRPTLPRNQRILVDMTRLIDLVLDVVYSSPCASPYVVWVPRRCRRRVVRGRGAATLD